MAHQTCRVDITTKDLGFLAAEPTGLATPVQAVRVVVTRAGESRSHVVVRAAAPPWALSEDEVVRRLFPTDFVSCVRFEAVGEMVISSSPADAITLFDAAAAVATLRASWGWDESPTIVVRVSPAGNTFAVKPAFANDAWTVTGGA
jgi:hypothetical protein